MPRNRETKHKVIEEWQAATLLFRFALLLLIILVILVLMILLGY